MSFNEIAEFRELLSRISKDQPGLINAGMRSLLWAIISQSDGCFVGYVELADQAGLTPGTNKTYLRRLTNLNLILREQSYVRRGIRQCYRVSLPGLRALVRVSPVTPIEVESSLLGITESVMGITESANGYHQSPTYRDKRNYKEERVNTNLSTFNLTRFQEVVLSSLPLHVREFVTPGSNFEKLLDELQLLGALDDVPGQLKGVNYDPGKNPGGLVLKVLNDLLSLSKQRIERDRLERERDQKVVRDLEEAERNKSSDPDTWIEVARKELAKEKDSPTVF
jgi:hypothetical protein